MPFKHLFILSLVTLSVSVARAKTTVYEAFGTYMSTEQYEPAYKLLETQLSSETNKDMAALIHFGLGVAANKLKWDDKAQNHLQESLKLGVRLDDYARYFLGQSLRRTGNFKEAKTEFNKVQDLKLRSPIKFYEAQFELGLVAMEEKNWKGAGAHFSKLERKMRSDSKYPQILWNLAKVELEQKRPWKACQWARKIYIKYPGSAVAADWGIDLQKASIDGKTLGCIPSPKDQRQHLQALLLAGQSERAKKEIEKLRERSNSMTKYHVESLWAAWLIHEGQVRDALNVLLPFYKDMSHNSDYLSLMAKAASRAGEYQLAVAAYSRIHNLAGGSKTGRSALFQAAFLSYQFQDYDGASRKFENLIQKYPRSGLARDSQWHQAWIRYLRGDYAGAYTGFQKLPKPRRKYLAQHMEKTNYWSAMALLKMGSPEKAIELFRQLVKVKSYGYYSLAAQARLAAIKILPPLERTIAHLPESKIASHPIKSIIPGLEPETLSQITVLTEAKKSSEENETEEDESTLATGEEDSDDADAGDDAAPTTTAEDNAEAETAGEFLAADFGADHDRKIASRFARAEDLLKIGFDDWAKYELLEIEKRTSRKAHLKNLLSAYEQSKAYYRSSYLAEINFGSIRYRDGFSGEGRRFWEAAYPRAFEKSVTTFAESYTVPQEFAWGIMRAESHFKTDVSSPVGAVGLMQLMPFTAARTAELDGFSEFSVGQLREPHVNIRLGTKYLGRLLKMFDGNIPLAAAAYNAGPHRVRAWLKSFGTLEMDEFVEHIPFLETRNYVKRVVHNYYIYRSLYAKKSEPPPEWIIKPVAIRIDGPAESKEIW